MKKIVILCIAAVSFAGCTGKKGVTAVAEDKGVLTKSAVAEEASVQLTEVFTSEIEPYKENDITPAASGVHIDRIYVEVGDPVREGQLVVTLDPTQYTQQLVQLKTVEDDYNRLLPVYEAGGISTQQIEQAKAQLDVQREVVANLKKNIEVRSPISGVVTARNYESGDLFAQQPILHIMQIDPLKVIANISEQYFPNVKVGMPVKLAVDIFPDEEFTGTVSLIYPALDPTTRTFKVEVKVPNAKRTLRPGMYARSWSYWAVFSSIILAPQQHRIQPRAAAFAAASRAAPSRSGGPPRPARLCLQPYPLQSPPARPQHPRCG